MGKIIAIILRPGSCQVSVYGINQVSQKPQLANTPGAFLFKLLFGTSRGIGLHIRLRGGLGAEAGSQAACLQVFGSWADSEASSVPFLCFSLPGSPVLSLGPLNFINRTSCPWLCWILLTLCSRCGIGSEAKRKVVLTLRICVSAVRLQSPPCAQLPWIRASLFQQPPRSFRISSSEKRCLLVFTAEGGCLLPLRPSVFSLRKAV